MPTIRRALTLLGRQPCRATKRSLHPALRRPSTSIWSYSPQAHTRTWPSRCWPLSAPRWKLTTARRKRQRRNRTSSLPVNLLGRPNQPPLFTFAPSTLPRAMYFVALRFRRDPCRLDTSSRFRLVAPPSVVRAIPKVHF